MYQRVTNPFAAIVPRCRSPLKSKNQISNIKNTSQNLKLSKFKKSFYILHCHFAF